MAGSRSRSFAVSAVIVAASLSVTSSVLAQSTPSTSFPSKPVKIVMPYSGGTGVAVFVRLVGDKLGQSWKSPVITEPKPGASGFIALEGVKKAAPDGHELFIAANSHIAINPALYKAKLPYDPQKDFVPVGVVYRTPFFITVSTSGPYQTVPALIEAAKARPGTISYGSSYVGSPSHLGSAQFEHLTGTKMIHVPYRDQSQMYTHIANGDLAWAFSTLGSALPLMKAGRIKVIAVGANERMESLPDVPTVAEAGGPKGLTVEAWVGLFAPRGTPAAIVQKINADMNAVLKDPDVRERMKAFGFQASISTPAELAKTIEVDLKMFAGTVERAGVTVD